VYELNLLDREVVLLRRCREASPKLPRREVREAMSGPLPPHAGDHGEPLGAILASVARSRRIRYHNLLRSP
jgi:hypothetical protein